MTEAVVPVSAGGDYDVVIGHKLMHRLPELIGGRAQKVLIIYPRALRTTGDLVRDDLQAAGYEALAAEIPDAEEAKHSRVAEFCWKILGQSDFTRTDVIVNVGGGAVTDLGGFVAATWLRGIRYINIPTTVLGMVDAAVGGKTGINTEEGKNLVGAFHAPAGVLCDLETLGTLPPNELFTGLAESVKCGFISDPEILDIIEKTPKDSLTDPESPELFEIIRRSIAVKAAIVSEDFQESGKREFLNFGHTLGHAIERLERYQWRHGAAVAVGMMFAAELSVLTKNLSEENVNRLRGILEHLGLPTGYRGDKWPQLLDTMRRDKKARGSLLRFVVLEDIGRPAVLEAADTSLPFSAYTAIGTDSPITRLS